jgi:hypothetical protein
MENVWKDKYETLVSQLALILNHHQHQEQENHDKKTTNMTDAKIPLSPSPTASCNTTNSLTSQNVIQQWELEKQQLCRENLQLHTENELLRQQLREQKEKFALHMNALVRGRRKSQTTAPEPHADFSESTLSLAEQEESDFSGSSSSITNTVFSPKPIRSSSRLDMESAQMSTISISPVLAARKAERLPSKQSLVNNTIATTAATNTLFISSGSTSETPTVSTSLPKLPTTQSVTNLGKFSLTKRASSPKLHHSKSRVRTPSPSPISPPPPNVTSESVFNAKAKSPPLQAIDTISSSSSHFSSKEEQHRLDNNNTDNNNVPSPIKKQMEEEPIKKQMEEESRPRSMSRSKSFPRSLMGAVESKEQIIATVSLATAASKTISSNVGVIMAKATKCISLQKYFIAKKFSNLTTESDKKIHAENLVCAHVLGRIVRGRFRKAIKKYKLLQEIIKTEESYVKRLDLIVNGYLLPLEKNCAESQSSFTSVLTGGQSMLPSNDGKLIFSQIQVIYLYHQNLLDDIRAKSAEPQWLLNVRTECIHVSCERILQKMHRFSQFMRCYTEYVNGFDRSVQTLERCRKKYSKFSVFCQAREKEQGETLSSLLIAPIQRIPRYVLLLQGILETTAAKNIDHALIEKTLRVIQTLAMQINERKRSDEAVIRVHKLYLQLYGAKTDLTTTVGNSGGGGGGATAAAGAEYNKMLEDLFLPHRRLLHEGFLYLRREGGSQKRDDEFCNVFLFTDLFLICQSRHHQQSSKNTPTTTTSISSIGPEALQEYQKQHPNTVALNDCLFSRERGEENMKLRWWIQARVEAVKALTFRDDEEESCTDSEQIRHAFMVSVHNRIFMFRAFCSEQSATWIRYFNDLMEYQRVQLTKKLSSTVLSGSQRSNGTTISLSQNGDKYTPPLSSVIEEEPVEVVQKTMKGVESTFVVAKKRALTHDSQQNKSRMQEFHTFTLEHERDRKEKEIEDMVSKTQLFHTTSTGMDLIVDLRTPRPLSETTATKKIHDIQNTFHESKHGHLSSPSSNNNIPKIPSITHKSLKDDMDFNGFISQKKRAGGANKLMENKGRVRSGSFASGESPPKYSSISNLSLTTVATATSSFPSPMPLVQQQQQENQSFFDSNSLSPPAESEPTLAPPFSQPSPPPLPPTIGENEIKILSASSFITTNACISTKFDNTANTTVSPTPLSPMNTTSVRQRAQKFMLHNASEKNGKK